MQAQEEKEVSLADNAEEEDDDGDFADLLMAELDEDNADAKKEPDEAQPSLQNPEVQERDLPNIQAAPDSTAKANGEASIERHVATLQLSGRPDGGGTTKAIGSGFQPLEEQPTAPALPPPPATNAALPKAGQNPSMVSARSGVTNAAHSKSAIAHGRGMEAIAPSEWQSWEAEKATRMRKGQRVYQVLFNFAPCMSNSLLLCCRKADKVFLSCYTTGFTGFSSEPKSCHFLSVNEKVARQALQNTLS